MALGGNGAFLLGAGGRCPWGPEKMQPELGGGGWSSGRSGWTTAALRRNEGITVRFQSCWEGTPFPPTGSQKLGLRPSRGTWRCPAGPHTPTPSSKVTWPHPPPTHPPAGTFFANSIFAPLGSSVEIKRLFAVTNVANSDQTI